MTRVHSFVAVVGAVAAAVPSEEDLSSPTALSVDRREDLKEDCNVEELKELFLARRVPPDVGGAPDEDDDDDDDSGGGGEVTE